MPAPIRRPPSTDHAPEARPPAPAQFTDRRALSRAGHLARRWWAAAAAALLRAEHHIIENHRPPPGGG